MEKMLEKLEHWREIMAERAAATIVGDSEIASKELSMTHEGHVKKTGQINGANKRRYFLFDNKVIKYYKTKKASVNKRSEKGRMSNNDMCAIADEENPRRFSIFSENKGVILCECDM